MSVEGLALAFEFVVTVGVHTDGNNWHRGFSDDSWGAIDPATVDIDGVADTVETSAFVFSYYSFFDQLELNYSYGAEPESPAEAWFEGLPAAGAVLRVYFGADDYEDFAFADAAQVQFGVASWRTPYASAAFRHWDEGDEGQERRVQVWAPPTETPLHERMQFSNFASTTLAEAISSSATQLRLAGNASAFPTLGEDQIFTLVVSEEDKYEVMYCTARTGDLLTVERAQENTTARPFSTSARVVHTVTAGFFAQLRQAGLGL